MTQHPTRTFNRFSRYGRWVEVKEVAGGYMVDSGGANVTVYTGLILGYRRGSNTQYENQVLIRIDGVDSDSKASRFVGWKVLFVDSKGNTYRGKIVRVHGRKGVVIAVFKPNLPGQAIGRDVYIYPPKGVELVVSKS
jgi:large subunit ribosomal protein L35Ae